MPITNYDASSDAAFGPAVRAARERAGLTQEEVASSMRRRGFDFHQATVYKVETGKRRVTVGEGLALSNLLRTPISVLASGDPESVSSLRFTAGSQAVDFYLHAASMYMSAEEGITKSNDLRKTTEKLDRSAPEGYPEIDGRAHLAQELFEPLLDFKCFDDFRDSYRNLLFSPAGKFLIHDVLGAPILPESIRPSDG